MKETPASFVLVTDSYPSTTNFRVCNIRYLDSAPSLVVLVTLPIYNLLTYRLNIPAPLVRHPFAINLSITFRRLWSTNPVTNLTSYNLVSKYFRSQLPLTMETSFKLRDDFM